MILLLTLHALSAADSGRDGRLLGEDGTIPAVNVSVSVSVSVVEEWMRLAIDSH